MLAFENVVVPLIDPGKLTPMPRVAPVIAQDTIFSLVDIKGSDK
jgi:hypothetical protein